MPAECWAVAKQGQSVFCDGGSFTIGATAGYDQYRWYKNGAALPQNGSELTITQTGIYAVEGYKCGRWSARSNNIVVTVLAAPAKPTVSKEETPDKVRLTINTAAAPQWLLNGSAIGGATAASFEPEQVGSYAVRITQNGCTNQSDAVTVSIEKPVVVVGGNSSICEGEAVGLAAPSGFGRYQWQKDGQSLMATTKELTVNTTGRYRVATQRGKIVSEWSEPVAIEVKPLPAKPTISLDGYALKSSSPANNQWYADGALLKDSTAQLLRGMAAGSYTVRVTERGCWSESVPFVITSVAINGTQHEVWLYPNPNEGSFRVKTPGIIDRWTLNVTDINGRSVYTKTAMADQLNAEPIHLKTPAGLYTLTITNGSNKGAVKFVVLP
jgi:hypothetical protein